MGGGKNSSLEAAALFADSLAEEVFIALGEAGRGRSFALHDARPARSVGENAVGMELWGYSGAGYRDSVAVGGVGSSAGRGVGVEDEHSSPVWTIGRRRGVAKLVDAGDDAAELIVSSSRDREAYLRGKIGLPRGNLASEIVIAIAGREPCYVGHVKGDKAR